MTVTVYCFNDAYSLALMLNGVQHFLGSGAWSNIVYLMLIITISVGIVRVVAGARLTQALQALILPVILYGVFFATPCNINLQDEYSDEVYSLSGIPFGVAAPLWISSKIEKSFVDVIDDYVMPASSPKFKVVDFFGQARLMAELGTTNLWINSELTHSFKNYFEDCILPELAALNFTMNDLKKTPDLMLAIASTNHGFFTQIYNGTDYIVQTCANAYSFIESRATAESQSTSSNTPFRRAGYVFGSRASNVGLLTSSYNSILSSLFSGQQDSMEALFKQNLLINTIRNAAAGISPDLMAVISEAESKYYTNTAVGALLYIKQLPKLRSMFKLVLVALFPVIGGFFFVQMAAPFFYWAGCLLWISLWLPAEAAVHAAYSVISISELRALIDFTGGYSLGNNQTIIKWATETAAVAGGVMVIVPILTGFLIRWAFPKLGVMIFGMLQAARGIGQAATAAAVGAVPSSGQRVLGLEQDKFREQAFDLGDRMTYARSQTKEMLGSYSGNLMQNTFNDAPKRGTQAERIEQSTGGPQVITIKGDNQTAQALENRTQSLETAQETSAYSLAHSAVSQYAKTGDSSSMKSAMSALTDVQQAAYQENYAFTRNHLDNHAVTSGWSSIGKDTLSHAVATEMTFGAKAQGRIGSSIQEQSDLTPKGGNSPQANQTGSSSSNVNLVDKVLGLFGLGVSGSLEAGIGGRIDASKTDTQEVSKGYSTDSKLGISDTHNYGFQESDGKATSLTESQVLSSLVRDGVSTSDGRTFTDQLSETATLSKQYQDAQAATARYQSLLGTGASMTMNMAQIYGAMSEAAVSTAAQQSTPEFRDKVHSGYQPGELRKEMAAGFTKAFHSGDGTTVLGMINGIRAAGEQAGRGDIVRQADNLAFAYMAHTAAGDRSGEGIDSSRFQGHGTERAATGGFSPRSGKLQEVQAGLEADQITAGLARQAPPQAPVGNFGPDYSGTIFANEVTPESRDLYFKYMRENGYSQAEMQGAMDTYRGLPSAQQWELFNQGGPDRNGANDLRTYQGNKIPEKVVETNKLTGMTEELVSQGNQGAHDNSQKIENSSTTSEAMGTLVREGEQVVDALKGAVGQLKDQFSPAHDEKQ